MTINRNIPPPTRTGEKIIFPEYHSYQTDNGIPVFAVHNDNCEVLKVELIFNAGSRLQSQAFQAQSTNTLISEGTPGRSSAAIAGELDYYGAFLQNRLSLDDASLTLFCLPKYASPCLSIIEDLINNAYYPDNEIDVYLKNASQKLSINEEKNSFLARRLFYQSIFGKTNWYGAAVNQQDISSISRETLVAFHTNYYRNQLKYILISGKISDETLKNLLQFASTFKLADTTYQKINIESTGDQRIALNKPNSVQSAIRIGRAFLTRTESDYRKFQMLNLILGGYFGSRLMTNIREEKGLTYGIYSVVESYKDSGAFYVDTEMNGELAEEGIAEIFKEIEALRNHPIPAAELETARNYMLGGFLRSLDGPFATADRVKVLIDYDLNTSYYDEYIEIIRSIQALTLQELANKYLNESSLKTVVVGKV